MFFSPFIPSNTLNKKMNKWIIGVVQFLILLSTAFLMLKLYTIDAKFKFKFRFYIFALEHIFTFFMLLFLCIF